MESSIHPGITNSFELYNNYNDYYKNNAVCFEGKKGYDQAVIFVDKINAVKHAPHFYEKKPQGNASSVADELLKLKQLLDEGLLTREEFQKEKEKLLGETASNASSSYSSSSYTSANQSYTQEASHSKTASDTNTAKTIQTPPKEEVFSDPYPTSEKGTVRKGMRALAIISIVFAIFAIINSRIEPLMLYGGVSFAIFSIMFFILAKSPKHSPYLFGKSKGIRKPLFVIICILLASMVVSTQADQTKNDSKKQNNNQESAIAFSQPLETNVATNVPTHTPSAEPTATPQPTTLNDVENWYNKQMAVVSQDMFRAFENVKGFSNLNIQSSRFRFGNNDGWYDCHYTFAFTCKVEGMVCNGEARAFLEYNGSIPEWFHLEIWRDSDWKTIFEHYDDSYDQIIEDHYKYLEEIYT